MVAIGEIIPLETHSVAVVVALAIAGVAAALVVAIAETLGKELRKRHKRKG
jgi:hypothetical protein